MANFGINENGFTLKRLPDIVSDIEQDQQQFFPGIDQSAESVNGQMIGVFAKPSTDVWEGLGQVFNSLSPSTAEGKQLDDVVAYNGLTRLVALPTIVTVGLNGTVSTSVPAGTQFRNSATQEIFEVSSDTTITDQQQLVFYVRVEDTTASDIYTIDINSTTETYTVNNASSDPDVIAGIFETNINAGSSLASAQALVNGVIKITSLLTNNPLDYSLTTSNLIYFTPSTCNSVNTGPLLSAANTINVIETPVSGLDEVNNFDAGDPGRETESDVDLRIRFFASQQNTGAGTLPSIISRILDDVDGVTSVKGFENRTDAVVDGRDPHSFEMVVEGGVDQDIGDLLWQIKPAGIQTFGNTPIIIVDSNGDNQTMNFSRPIGIPIWVRATITKYSEESYPTTGDQQVEDAILAYGDAISSGEDVIPLRIKTDIINAVTGIEDIVMEITKTAPPPYGLVTIPIAENEIATFDSSRIIVIS